MIAFGTAVTDLKAYDSCAAPGIELVAEPDSEVFVHQGTGSLFRNYNLILDLAKKHDDLEALALIHQDAEIADPDFCAKVREALEDPDVAIVGCAGALGVRGIAWWEGALTWASFTHRYEELGGGEFPAPSWNAHRAPSFAQTGEVDSIDGFIIVMSPWAVHNLRFDESLGKLHGYDFDICMQAREAGKKVVTTDFRAIHHHSLALISDPDSWIEAHIRITEKWDGRMESSPELGDWRTRALRAEAEAAASKGQMVSANLRSEAIERQLRRVEESASWKLTRPLRNRRLRVLRKRR
jgi:GT2 family glycosyltransferase